MMAENGFALLQFTLESTLPALVTLYEEASAAELRLAALMAVHKLLTFMPSNLLATTQAVNVSQLSHMLFSVLEGKHP